MCDEEGERGDGDTRVRGGAGGYEGGEGEGEVACLEGLEGCCAHGSGKGLLDGEGSGIEAAAATADGVI